MSETISLDEMFNPNRTFVLKARTDVMLGAHICDGDYVIFDRDLKPKNGDVVVAVLDDGTCMMREYAIHDDGKTVYLSTHPDGDESHATRDVPADRVTIQGVLIGVLRSYAERK